MTLAPASSHGGSSPVVVPISSAQLLAIGTTAVRLVAAPAAGQMILVQSAWFVYTPGTIGYTGDVAFEIGYGPFIDAALLEADITGAFFDNNPLIAPLYPIGSLASPRQVNPTSMRGAALYMDNSGNALTLGNGTLAVVVQYVTVRA